MVPFACALRLPPDNGMWIMRGDTRALKRALVAAQIVQQLGFGTEASHSRNRNALWLQKLEPLGIGGKAGSPRRAIEIVWVMRLSAHAICVERVS